MKCGLWKIWSHTTDRIADSFRNPFCSWGTGTALARFGSLPQAEGVLGQQQLQESTKRPLRGQSIWGNRGLSKLLPWGGVYHPERGEVVMEALCHLHVLLPRSALCRVTVGLRQLHLSQTSWSSPLFPEITGFVGKSCGRAKHCVNKSQHFQWAPAVLVAVAALPSFLGFKDPPVYISLPVLWGRGHAEESSHGQGKEGSGGRMGLRHPVPFGGEWLQIAELEGRNTLCVLARAAWTQRNQWIKEKRQATVCNCSKLPQSLRTSF